MTIPRGYVSPIPDPGEPKEPKRPESSRVVTLFVLALLAGILITLGVLIGKEQ